MKKSNKLSIRVTDEVKNMVYEMSKKEDRSIAYLLDKMIKETYNSWVKQGD